jgi:1-acyl-sn-glycerol-3-phosphate acyltransferase
MQDLDHSAQHAPRGRWLRVAVYFLVFFPSFLVFDLLLRTWATGFGFGGEALRRRRINAVLKVWARALTWWTTRVMAVRIDVRGAVPPGRFVVVSNHQSLTDIPFLMWALQPLNLKFVTRADLARGIPIISFGIREGGMAAVSRRVSRKDQRTLIAMGEELEAWNGSAVVFAEGRRFDAGELGRYRAGAARALSESSGLPLLPVCIDGTHRAVRLKDMAGPMFGMPVRITIGYPLPCPESDDACRSALSESRGWAEGEIRDGRERAEAAG